VPENLAQSLADRLAALSDDPDYIAVGQVNKVSRRRAGILGVDGSITNAQFQS
jgi:hypothetical protein